MTLSFPAQWPGAFAGRPVVVAVSAAWRRVTLSLLTFTLILSGCSALTVVNLHDRNGGRARVKDGKFAGRVAVSAAPTSMAATRASCTAAGACSAATTISVGYNLAGFRSYPNRLTMRGAVGRGWRDREAAANDVRALMDRAFSPRLKLGGVHLDAYADPTVSAKICREQPTKRCALISRREPPWRRLTWDSFRASQGFAVRNTLGATLDHFARHYVAQGKHLYLQLHEPGGCAMGGPSGLHSCHGQIGNIIRRILAIDGAKQRLGRSLAFVSLSRHILEVAHNQAASLGLAPDRVRFILIAGAHFAGESRAEAGCGMVATSTQVLTRARRTERAWMASTPWLDAVWVLPRCFTTAGAVLAAVNVERAKQPTPMGVLSMGVATYAWPRPRIDRWIQQTLTGDHVMKVSSLIFAIDED